MIRARVLVNQELERIVKPFAFDADLARGAHVTGERGAQLRCEYAASKRIDQLVCARRKLAQAGIVLRPRVVVAIYVRATLEQPVGRALASRCGAIVQ
jgi:hypothetical protein